MWLDDPIWRQPDYHSVQKLVELNTKFKEHSIACQKVLKEQRLRPQSHAVETHQKFNENMSMEIVATQNSGTMQHGFKFVCTDNSGEQLNSIELVKLKIIMLRNCFDFNFSINERN